MPPASPRMQTCLPPGRARAPNQSAGQGAKGRDVFLTHLLPQQGCSLQRADPNSSAVPACAFPLLPSCNPVPNLPKGAVRVRAAAGQGLPLMALGQSWQWPQPLLSAGQTSCCWCGHRQSWDLVLLHTGHTGCRTGWSGPGQALQQHSDINSWLTM